MEKKNTEKKENEVIDIDTNLIGSINYKLNLTNESFAAQYNVNVENNLIAAMMVKEMLGHVVARQTHPLTLKKDKLTSKEYSEVIQTINHLDKMAQGMAGHIVQTILKGQHKVDLEKPEGPKIITLNK